MKRRYKVTVVILAIVALMVSFSPAQAAAGKSPIQNIIIFIGDGMQMEHEIAASRYLTGKDEFLSFHKFSYKNSVSTWDVSTYNRYAAAQGTELYDPENFNPLVGYNPAEGGAKPFPDQKNHVSDAYFMTKLGGKYPATDSASAGTALATGYKTDDGNVCWLPGDPDGGALTTIAELLRSDLNWSIGVVSTVPFSHATPACFVSHNKSRNNYNAIADEIIRVVQPDVVIGGGHRAYSPSYMSQTLYNDVKSGFIPAYHFVERQAGVDGGVAILQGADAAIVGKKKLFGLFGGAGGNFESPIPTDNGTAVINRATIENPLLRDATVAALKVLSQNEKGFFLMVEQGDIDWANHANDFPRMIGTMWDLDEAVKAALEFIDRPGDNVHRWNTLVIVTSDHGNSYMRNLKKLGKGILAKKEQGDISYGCGDHTNELVKIYATGSPGFVETFKKYEGSWYPGTRIIDNTQLYHIMTEIAGIPQESPLTAILPDNYVPAFAWGK